MQLIDTFFKVHGMQVNATEAQVTGVLNPQHPIFKAHFPGHPITPGVCIVRLATELLSLVTGRRLTLVKAKNVKFLNLVIPDGETILDFFFSKLSADGDTVTCTLVVKSDSSVYSKLSLVYE